MPSSRPYSEQARIERVGSGRDQLNAATAGFASLELFRFHLEFIPLRLPLIDVLLFVQVSIDQAFGRVEENATIFSEAQTIASQGRFSASLLAGRVARRAVELSRGGVVAEHLALAQRCHSRSAEASR